MRGEKEYLQKENEKLKGKYTGENQVNDLSIYKTLFKMDPKRYGETMGDLTVGPDDVPLWANMDFLERGHE